MLIVHNPPQLGFTHSGAAAGGLDQIKQWLSEHQTTVYIVAGALLVLAIWRRR